MKYTRSAILDAMKARQQEMKNKIAKENSKLHRMRNKSQRVRLASNLGPRIGYFRDHLYELGFAISLLEGRADIETYPTDGITDETSNLIEKLCDMTR